LIHPSISNLALISKQNIARSAARISKHSYIRALVYRGTTVFHVHVCTWAYGHLYVQRHIVAPIGGITRSKNTHTHTHSHTHTHTHIYMCMYIENSDTSVYTIIELHMDAHLSLSLSLYIYIYILYCYSIGHMDIKYAHLSHNWQRCLSLHTHTCIHFKPHSHQSVHIYISPYGSASCHLGAALEGDSLCTYIAEYIDTSP
jgi:hypothetical protein